MKAKFDEFKTFIKNHDSKKNRIVAGGVCAVLVLGLVGVGVGLNMANSANLDPAKALTQAEDSNSDNKADENAENKDGSTEQSESAAAESEEITVNENGEVVDENGNVVAESVEAYNATPQAQGRPVNATSGNSSNSSSTPSSQPSINSSAAEPTQSLGARVEGNLNYGHYERQPYEVKVEDGYWEYIDGGRCNECGTYLYNGQQSVREHFEATGHGSHSSFQIPTGNWIDCSYTYTDYKNVWVWDR